MEPSELTAKAAIIVRRPPTDVFDAFADPRSMSRFWFTRRDDGLEQGESILLYVGAGHDAFSFEARVIELSRPDKLVIDWGTGDEYTRVSWSFAETDNGDTILAVEESGFTGSDDEIIARALDSTGGFNQVVVAAKALVEHGVAMNLVADRA